MKYILVCLCVVVHGWQEDQHGGTAVNTGDYTPVDPTSPVATDQSGPHSPNEHVNGYIVYDVTDGSTWNASTNGLLFDAEPTTTTEATMGSTDHKFIANSDTIGHPFSKHTFRNNYYPGFYKPPNPSDNGNDGSFTYRAYDTTNPTYQVNTDQNSFNPADLGKHHTYDLEYVTQSNDQYRGKIVFEIQKFFKHARKWIWELSPPGGKSTYHFTYSFSFSQELTDHMNGWIQWLYYIISNLQPGGNTGGTQTNSGKIIERTTSIGDIAESLWETESATWVLLDEMTNHMVDFGSVTLTQSFQLLDNIAGTWPMVPELDGNGDPIELVDHEGNTEIDEEGNPIYSHVPIPFDADGNPISFPAELVQYDAPR